MPADDKLVEIVAAALAPLFPGMTPTYYVLPEARRYAHAAISALRAHTALPSDAQGAGDPRCQKCGNSHAFDTSVPGDAWNAVIRSAGLPEYLCFSCVVQAFALARQDFQTKLFGDGLDGIPVMTVSFDEAQGIGVRVTDEMIGRANRAYTLSQRAGRHEWMRDALTAALAAAPEQAASWRSIESDPPPDNHIVLLGWERWRDKDWMMAVGPASWGGDFGNGYSNRSSHGQATHWASLDTLYSAGRLIAAAPEPEESSDG